VPVSPMKRSVMRYSEGSPAHAVQPTLEPRETRPHGGRNLDAGEQPRHGRLLTRRFGNARQRNIVSGEATAEGRPRRVLLGMIADVGTTAGSGRKRAQRPVQKSIIVTLRTIHWRLNGSQ
jgi:hypothetical protein